MLLPELNSLAEQYSETGVHFLFVYIMEAHAADEWPIKELPQEINQHRSLEERIEAARNFLVTHPLHSSFTLTVDNMENDFVDLYCSWPFRYWVIQDGIIRLKSMPDGDKVFLDSLREWLEANA